MSGVIPWEEPVENMYEGCHWCGGEVEDDKDFCSNECKRKWVAE